MKGLRIGEKVTGEVAKIGHKVRDYGKYAALAAGALGPEAAAAVGAAAGVAGKVGDVAEKANKSLKDRSSNRRVYGNGTESTTPNSPLLLRRRYAVLYTLRKSPMAFMTGRIGR